jgi:dephospho-CoA kinase
VVGDQCSGKTTLANYFKSQFGYHLVEMKAIDLQIRQTKVTEDLAIDDVPKSSIQEMQAGVEKLI